jgi:arylsulfatase A
VAATCFAAAQPAQTPNIVILYADDLGYGDLGCYGHPEIATPNLDELAAEGMLFTDAYAGSAVCAPSRASLLSGRSTPRHGVETHKQGSNFADAEVTIAEVLKGQGYSTFAAGKWHVGSRNNADEQGFDHWLLTGNNALPSHENPDGFARNGTSADVTGFSCDIIVDEAIGWLDGLPGNARGEPDSPVFLYLPFHNPHEPVASARQYLDQYAHLDYPFQDYYANVTHLDAAIGRLLDDLEDRGMTDNTLVVFSSDNGPQGLEEYSRAKGQAGTPAHLRAIKARMYEGGIRVPMIIRWPGQIPAGSRNYQMVSQVDLAPTVAAITGSELLDEVTIDGVDIRPLFSGGTVSRTYPLYWSFPPSYTRIDLRIAMRFGDWKLMTDHDFSRWELYHLRSDAGERNNLAHREPAKLAEMQAIFTAYRNELGLPTP